MRPINLLITLVTLCFSLTAIAEPLYWSARKDGRDLLLFGSLHVGNEEMYPLPAMVNDYLRHSDGLVTEIDLSSMSQPKLPAATHTALDVLEYEHKLELKKRLQQYSLPTELLHTAPWITAMSLQMKQLAAMGYRADQGVDQVVTRHASEIKLPLYGFETMDFQLNLLNDLPGNGTILLTELLSNWEESNLQLKCQIASWKAGDKQRLLTLLESGEYDKATLAPLLTDRNHNWANMLSSDWLPEKGRFVVVVGALHLIGEDNLPDLLRDKGWQVELLSKPGKADCGN